MEQILKELDGVYFNLIHQKEKDVGIWYVIGVEEINKKYGMHPPVFHSDTIEECLTLLLEELKTIRA